MAPPNFFLAGGGGCIYHINNLRYDATDYPPFPTVLVKLVFIDRDVGVKNFPFQCRRYVPEFVLKTNHRA